MNEGEGRRQEGCCRRPGRGLTARGRARLRAGGRLLLRQSSGTREQPVAEVSSLPWQPFPSGGCGGAPENGLFGGGEEEEEEGGESCSGCKAERGAGAAASCVPFLGPLPQQALGRLARSRLSSQCRLGVERVGKAETDRERLWPSGRQLPLREGTATRHGGGRALNRTSVLWGGPAGGPAERSRSWLARSLAPPSRW